MPAPAPTAADLTADVSEATTPVLFNRSRMLRTPAVYLGLRSPQLLPEGVWRLAPPDVRPVARLRRSGDEAGWRLIPAPQLPPVALPRFYGLVTLDAPVIFLTSL
ncbi:MAG: hypothetical protein ACREJ2_00655 [Planctomycetota bacterium]